jgi:ComF family protein
MIAASGSFRASSATGLNVQFLGLHDRHSAACSRPGQALLIARGEILRTFAVISYKSPGAGTAQSGPNSRETGLDQIGMMSKSLVMPHLKSLLEYVLPACCLLCGQASPQRLLCPGCDNDLPRIGDCCGQCALPGGYGAARLCADCLRHQPAWDQAIAALVYEYPVDHLVRHFKFHKDMCCGQLLADELARAVALKFGQAEFIPEQKPDLLVPVPLHFLRRCRRGFNQAEVIATELQRVCGIPIQHKLLQRIAHTPAQSGLDRQARQKNLRDAFRCAPLQGTHVALVDDVLTTGATLQECARVLKRAGASRVSVWVAARVPAPSG